MRLRMCVVAGFLLPLVLGRVTLADTCDPNDPTLLKPDLVVLPMTKVRVLQRGGHRVVIFTTSVGNIGQGPMILQGHTIDGPNGPVTQATQVISRSDGTTCTHVAGDFEFHPAHHHWHFDDFASYQLRKDDPFTGPIVAESTKVSFCLIDVMQMRGFNDPVTIHADCLNQEGMQGIDVGFADVYDSFLPGQDIDLDADPNNPVPGGNYFLVNVANPDGLIWEVNDDLQANAAVASVSVPDPVRGLPSQPPPSQSPPSSATPTATPTNPPAPQPTPRPGPHQHPPHAPHVPHGGPSHQPGHQPFLGPRPVHKHVPAGTQSPQH